MESEAASPIGERTRGSRSPRRRRGASTCVGCHRPLDRRSILASAFVSVEDRKYQEAAPAPRRFIKGHRGPAEDEAAVDDVRVVHDKHHLRREHELRLLALDARALDLLEVAQHVAEVDVEEPAVSRQHDVAVVPVRDAEHVRRHAARRARRREALDRAAVGLHVVVVGDQVPAAASSLFRTSAFPRRAESRGGVSIRAATTSLEQRACPRAPWIAGASTPSPRTRGRGGVSTRAGPVRPDDASALARRPTAADGSGSSEPRRRRASSQNGLSASPAAAVAATTPSRGPIRAGGRAR